MRYETVVHENLTKTKFGYTSESLSINSHKPIVVECTNCHYVFEKEFRYLNRKHQCSVIDGDTKRCFKCKEWKNLSLFNKCPKLSGGVAKLCRECYNKHDAVIKAEYNRSLRMRRAFSTDIKEYIRYRLYSIKSACKAKGIKFDLEVQELLDLWNEQQGRCYYSNLEMKAEGKVNGMQGWFSPSLDRKDPAIGYTRDNVVWCCFCVNSFKQSMTEKQFKQLLKTIQWKI